MKRVLICEDNAEAVEVLQAILRTTGEFEVTACGTGTESLARWSEGFDLLLLDLGLPDLDGLTVLRKLRETDPAARVIVTTASSKVDNAVDALRAGALHYIRKPVRAADLRAAVREATAQVAPRSASTPRAPAKAGEGLMTAARSPAMLKVYELVDRVADKRVSVLIHGPTGSGKEHIARSIHERSGRTGPFIAVSCPSIPEALAESILFGHEKGSFTGAVDRQVGKLKQADKGTVFLDEIADMPAAIQVKLLRTLQERTVEAVGGEAVPVDFRVICASSRNLRQEVASGKFREDLLFRLADIELMVPALKDRGDDIGLLAQHFADEYTNEQNEPRRELGPAVLQRLTAYHWPGNVRELRSIIRRLCIMAPPGEVSLEGTGFDRYLPQSVVTPSPEGLTAVPPPQHHVPPPPGATQEAAGEDLSLVASEKQQIERALATTGHNIVQTAKILKIGRATLYRKMKKYGLAS